MSKSDNCPFVFWKASAPASSLSLSARSVAPQMNNLETAAYRQHGDQPSPVALAGVFFAAEQDGAESCGSGEHIRERLLERRPLRQAIVENVTLRVVESSIVRPAAQDRPRKR